jgi:hypothetical protein
VLCRRELWLVAVLVMPAVPRVVFVWIALLGGDALMAASRRLGLGVVTVVACAWFGLVLCTGLAGADEGCANGVLRELQQTSSLPECRAYEMVSPADKEGANIGAVPGRTQAAEDGNSILFFSKTAFGDALGSEQPGAEYIARRGEDGWPMHSVNPPQSSVYAGVFEPSRYVSASPDLSKGVFFALAPVLSGHPNVESLENLYLRTDLMTPGAGHYELASDAFSPLEALKGQTFFNPTIAFDWASADWSHILFQSYANLTPETSSLDPKAPKVYEWHNGVVTFAGVLPDSACASPPCLAAESIGGNGGGIDLPSGVEGVKDNEDWPVNSISADGSRVIFQAGPFTKVFLGDNFASIHGDLYMRIDKSVTVQLNASERKEPDPRGHLPARFMGATPDDSKILFETEEMLTDDALLPSEVYMYDVNAPAGRHLSVISIDHNPAEDNEFGSQRALGGPVPALSRDGGFAYFFSKQELVSGQPGNPGGGSVYPLYVWHDGTVRLITYHETQGFEEANWGEETVRNRPEHGEDEFRMDADGKKIVFGSLNKYSAQRAGVSAAIAETGRQQIYVYDYDTDTIACASCAPDGALPTSNARFETQADGALSASSTYLNHAMSSDGRFVFFDTGDPLVSQDTNGRRDVYEYDTVTGEVHLLSDGTCDCDATFADASPDGRDVFFTTRQRLVRIDVDFNSDMYDVRVNGGLLAQNAAPPAHCSGEECRGPARSAPVFSVPSSDSFAGVGNPSPTPVAKAKAKSKRPTLAQALRACRHKPKKKRAGCRARVRKAYHAKRSTVLASRRAGR